MDRWLTAAWSIVAMVVLLALVFGELTGHHVNPLAYGIVAAIVGSATGVTIARKQNDNKGRRK